MSDYGDALRILKTAGNNSAYLPEMLLALGFHYQPTDDEPERDKAAEPARIEPTPNPVLKKNGQDFWHFPLVVVKTIEKQAQTSQKSVLSEISSHPRLSNTKIAGVPPLKPASLWLDTQIKNCLHAHLYELRYSHSLDLQCLTRKLARKECVTHLPYRQHQRLPGEVWLYLDVSGSHLLLVDDYSDLFTRLKKCVGLTGVTRIVELVMTQHQRITWRVSRRLSTLNPDAYENSPLPVPPAGAYCVVVASRASLWKYPWKYLHYELMERQVTALWMPLDSVHAATNPLHLPPPIDYHAQKEKVLAALSLSPHRISLAMIRALRLALTELGPELELDIVSHPGINWHYSLQRGEWHEGASDYQRRFAQLLAQDDDKQLAEKALKMINKHLPENLESVVREHQLLALTYASQYLPQGDDLKKQLADYYTKAASTLLSENPDRPMDFKAQEELAWWLRQAMRLRDTLHLLPKETQRCYTVAKLVWEKQTHDSIQMPVLDEALWSEWMQTTSNEYAPGVICYDGDHLSLHDTSHQPPGGVPVAHLKDVQHILPDSVGQSRRLARPESEIKLRTLRETVTLQTLTSHDFYWAQSLSVTQDGVTAQSENIQVRWPSWGERAGPLVDWLPEAEPGLLKLQPKLDQYGLSIMLKVQGAPYAFRYLPPGSFLMGSPEDEPERIDNEQQHAVTFTQGFWLGETTVTQALWQAVMGENPSHFKAQSDEALPVENVNWDDCQEFCQRANAELPGLKLTLPTEAQWEYACRAGTQTPFSTGQSLSTEQANYHGGFPYAGGVRGEHRARTLPVYQFMPNPWGFYQMHGNVWEWCLDGGRQYSVQVGTAPVKVNIESGRALRGGSWNGRARNSRSAYRLSNHRDYRHFNIGLRIALVASSMEGDDEPSVSCEQPERSQAGERQAGASKRKKVKSRLKRK